MKKQKLKNDRRNWLKSSLLFISSFWLSPFIVISCKQESEDGEELSDILDYSNTIKLKQLISDTSDISDLPETFYSEAEKIVTDDELDEFSYLDPGSLAQFYQDNLTLSNEEITLLQANNYSTFFVVLNRLLSPPEYINSDKLTILYKKIKSNEYLSQYCPSISGDFTNPYPNNMYDGILDISSYIQSYRIDSLEILSQITADGTKSSMKQTGWGLIIIIIIIILLWPTELGDGEIHTAGGGSSK